MFHHSRQYFYSLPYGVISGTGELVLEPCHAPLYLHGAVDLGSVEHELEVPQAAQGGLPGHVLFLVDQEEGVVQRQGDRDYMGTGSRQRGSSKHPHPVQPHCGNPSLLLEPEVPEAQLSQLQHSPGVGLGVGVRDVDAGWCHKRGQPRPGPQPLPVTFPCSLSPFYR